MSCRPSLQEDLINRLETAGVIDQDLRVLSPGIISQLNRIYDEYGQHLFSVNNGFLTIHRDLLEQIDLTTSGPANIASTIYELEPEITENKIQSIYTNYVNLMNRAREGKAMSFNSFMSVLKSFQVYKYKDTYIFGQYDTATATFITRVNSSPSSRELLAEAIPNIVNNGVDFISFVPKDYADKLVRSGYTSSTASFGYNFKGENMQKFAVASNPQVFQKIFNKKANQVTATEIEAFNNSKEFKYAPVEIREDLIKKAGKDASKILETYLKQFGIAVKDIKEIQNQVGIDEVGFADILSKIAYVKNRENLPPVAGEFIAFMMQYNPLVEDIIKELSQTDNYKGLNKTQYLKIIGELIAEDLQNKLEGKYNKSLIDKIKDLINRFFELIKKTPVDKINTNIGIITNNILQQNKKLITSSLYKPGAFGKPVQQVSIESALKKDKFGASIVKTLSSQGFVLTGSTALSEQGIILRPDENPLHDIDWVSPFNRAETQERFLEKYPDAIKVRDIYGDDYVTDSYLIAPEGYSVVNYVVNSFDGKIIIGSYDIADSDGNIVGTYRLGKNPNTNASEEIVTGIEGKVIDFFSYSKPKELYKPFKYQTKNGDFISLSNWKDIFRAKLAFARYKDIWDYNRFTPNENVQIPAFQDLASVTTEGFQESLRSVAPVALSNLSALGPLQGETLETEKGQIGVNKQQLLFLLGPTMYSKPLADVAVKELLQNSFDAVKARQNFQKQVTESTPGNIQITLDYKNRTIAIQDDGVGMTPEIVKNAFLSIGGTNKEGLDVSERSGGFGLAKVQFLLGSEYVKVSTVRDGVRTFLQATAVQLYNDDFVINRELTNEPNGTYVEIKIPESYTTPEGTVRPISFPGGFKSQGQTHTAFDILNNPLIGDVNVTLDVISDKPHKYTLPLGKNITEELLPPLFSKIEFDWGTADLYMSINSYEDNSRAKHKILSSGIYQFDERFTLGSEKIPYDIVVNIKPSVNTTAEQYPFNNQREGFKRTVSEDIKALSLYLAKYAAGEADKALASSFSDIVSLPKIDPTVNLEPEERNRIFESVTKTVKGNKEIEAQPKRREVESISVSKGVVKNEGTGEVVATTSEKSYKESFKADKEIAKAAPVESSAFNPVLPQYHNNTTFNYLEIPGAAEFFSDFGSVVLDTVRFAGNKLGYDYKKLRSEDVPFFAGVSIDKGYAGVHVRKILNGIFINPLAFKAESLEEAVGQALHIVIHEINHTTVSGEGAQFTTALALLYGKIYGTGQYGLYEALFRAVYKKHFETYKILRNEYTKSTTRNLSKGFSGDELQGGPSRDVQRNVDNVQTGQTTFEGYTGDQYDNTKDRVGDVILSNINQVVEPFFPDIAFVPDNLINELFVSGAIDIIDSNPVLYNYDRKTFDDIEVLKAYANNKLKQRLSDPNIITSDSRPSISLNGRTKEQAIQDEVKTQVESLVQAYGTGPIKSQRIAREINQTFNAKIATEVNGKVEVLIPNSLYYQYETQRPDYVTETDLTNIYADTYVIDDYPIHLDRKNNEVVLESYHPSKAEETIKLLTLLSKNKFIVKSYQPSKFWETLLQMDMAVRIDDTYYLTPKPMTQSKFDSAYRQLVERPDLPIDVSGTEDYKTLLDQGVVLPETNEDLTYCNV